LRFVSYETFYLIVAYECLLGALEMGYNVDGYLVVDEKTLIHPWNFKGQFNDDRNFVVLNKRFL
jgi:hypothetical protein